jgi:hypothetical protein
MAGGAAAAGDAAEGGGDGAESAEGEEPETIDLDEAAKELEGTADDEDEDDS